MGWNEQLRAQHRNNNCLDRLVLRSAPHVLRLGRYSALLTNSHEHKSAACTACTACTAACMQRNDHVRLNDDEHVQSVIVSLMPCNT